MIIKYKILIPILFIIFNITLLAQKDSLQNRIGEIVKNSKGKVGVVAVDRKTGDKISINGKERFPMQSVFKFPLALKVLNEVDKGSLKLSHEIYIKSNEVVQYFWNPMQKEYGTGNLTLTIQQLLTLMVSKSDNNACDILFRLIGGPKVANDFIHGLDISDMAIVSTEREIQNNWNDQYKNWSSPNAMAQLLNKFVDGKILSKNSTKILWDLMVQSSTGSKKIRAGLPEGAIVAHKSGLSERNNKGITGASNDIGIVVMPDGRQVIIVVFITDSSDEEIEHEKLIAKITKTVLESIMK
jgi:beta-lactamase class A